MYNKYRENYGAIKKNKPIMATAHILGVMP